MSASRDSQRLFVAVELPNDVREAVARRAEAMRSLPGAAAVRWVRPKSYHLTLRFLGEVDPMGIAPLRRQLIRELATIAPFRMTLSEPCLFPTARRPRLISLAAHPEDDLRALAESVERGVRRAGFPPEVRPFKAHLTLGRIRALPAPQGLTGDDAATSESFAPGIRVREVALFRSQLRRDGAVYTVLERMALAAATPAVTLSPPNPSFEGEDHGKARTQTI